MINNNNISYFDAHCDTLSRCLKTGESLLNNRGQCDLTRLANYQPSGQVFAIFQDAANSPPNSPGLWEITCQMADLFRRGKEKYPDLMKQAVLSIEGGELLNCDPDKLDIIKTWGVRMVNLTWNHGNLLSGSNLENPDQGLTDVGRAFVRRAGELKIYPDVSHLSDPGFYDLADMGVLPLLASHSNSRAICPHKRNLTDEQFRIIRDSHGLVGINLYTHFIGGDGSMDDICKHFDHFLDLGGEKILALGSDWDGNITGAGGIQGVQDMTKLADAMLRRGYGEKLTRDIFYGNLARFLGFESN